MIKARFALIGVAVALAAALLCGVSGCAKPSAAAPAPARASRPASAPAKVAAATITTVDVATLGAAQLDKWSDASTEDGIAFRKALAGKFSTARIQAWWKDGDLRPAEGSRFVLEVKYKDVIAKPASFSIFSGIGKNFGYWSLQQFGGSNDGQWKTASIPVPWDMVARIVSSIDPSKNFPEMTAFAIASATDLPVASVTVRKAVRADEAKFYADCRRIITAAQAKQAASQPVPAVKDAPKVDGPIAAFPWEPGMRLFTNCAGIPGQMGKPVKVRMSQNELEPGSFGVYANGQDLKDVSYEITPLINDKGWVLKADVKLRTAEYALLDNVWTPVRLWPAYAVDIPAGRSHWFYFNIQTQRGQSAPGDYMGKILIHAKNAKIELSLNVTVLPVDLLTMDEAGLTMFGCYDRLPPLHDVEFQRLYNYGGALLWYAGFAPPVALKDGKMVFDFTYPDDWMKGARQRGFTGAIWYLGGDPFRMPNTLHVFANMGTLDKKMTREQWCEAQKGKGAILPETRKLFVEWMRTVNAHAVDSGWLELFPTPHDEPQKWVTAGAWIKPFFKDGCAAIHEADPRIRVYGCIHHVGTWHDIPNIWKVFIDDIDVFNTNNVAEDPDIANKIRQASAESIKNGGKGKLFWQYTGLGGGVPESQRYAFGFFFGAYGSTGFTAWAYNWDDQWDLSGRKGDLAVTGWPTAYETIPSPWFEAQREGLDDRRVIATYQKRFANDPAAMKVLNDILDQAKTSRSKKSGNDKEAGFFDSIDDQAKLVAWRNILLDRLAEPIAPTE